jgi:hypothetical protein
MFLAATDWFFIELDTKILFKVCVDRIPVTHAADSEETEESLFALNCRESFSGWGFATFWRGAATVRLIVQLTAQY